MKTIAAKKAIFIYALVSLFLLFEMAVQVSPSVLAPELMSDLNLSEFSLGIMSSVYFYSYTFMQVPSGLLFDRLRARNIIFVAILVCSAGTILFGYVSNFYIACFARLLIGAGSAFAFVSVLMVSARLFESRWFPLLAGITQMLSALGAVAGQLPIRYLADELGWHNTIVILGLAGLLLSVLILLLLDDQKNQSAQRGRHLRSVSESLKTILLNQQTWAIALYACLLWAPMSGFASLWGVSFLKEVDGLSSSSAAWYCSVMWLGLAVSSPILGMVSANMTNKITPLIVSAFVGAIVFGCVLYFSLPNFLLLTCLFLSGAACAGQALSFDLVKNNNPESVRGTAIALNNMAVVISGVFFQPMIGAIISSTTDQPVAGFSLSSAYKNGLLVIFISYLMAGLVAMLLIKQKRHSDLQLKSGHFKTLKSWV